ncbi:hypothetical protein GCM10009720_26800 [Yaniella flava]|uniref:Uncharacterized protein n=1 Tax=Yaniella flava TaxID=287930 RepID=A0ABN2UWX2_9MICC
MQRDGLVEIWTREEAEARCEAIFAEVGNVEKFRRRGRDFELDAEELVLYDELTTLEYLLDE